MTWSIVYSVQPLIEHLFAKFMSRNHVQSTRQMRVTRFLRKYSYKLQDVNTVRYSPQRLVLRKGLCNTRQVTALSSIDGQSPVNKRFKRAFGISYVSLTIKAKHLDRFSSTWILQVSFQNLMILQIFVFVYSNING